MILIHIGSFFENPRPPGGAPGLPYLHLWDYETVELFFLNNREQYLEVQVTLGDTFLGALKGSFGGLLGVFGCRLGSTCSSPVSKSSRRCSSFLRKRET